MSRSAFSSNQLNVVGPSITTSAISGGPPANPTDGDIWIASGVDSNGVRWQFQYNAGSSSTYKWEFIGGARVHTHYDYPGSTNIGLSTATAIPNCSITVPRAGDYIFDASGMLTSSVAGSWEWLLTLYQNGSFVTGGYYGYPIVTTPTNGGVAIAGHFKVAGAAANDVFVLRAEVTATSGTCSVSMGRFSCIPTRIS